MNKIDKRFYEHLRVLAKIPTDEPYGKYKSEVTKKYKKYMDGETWDELHKLGYISTSSSNSSIVTPTGLELLRVLEDIRRKDRTLIASVIAVIVSLASFVISLVSLVKSAG